MTLAPTVDGCARLVISGDPDRVKRYGAKLADLYRHDARGREWVMHVVGQELLCGWLNPAISITDAVMELHSELENELP
jgi:hypothetical protein